MNKSLSLLCFALLFSLYAYTQLDLPVFNHSIEKHETDWLIFPCTITAGVYNSEDKKDIILFNGLVKRTFRIQPNIACIDYINLSNGQQLLRAVKPEATIEI